MLGSIGMPVPDVLARMKHPAPNQVTTACAESFCFDLGRESSDILEKEPR